LYALEHNVGRLADDHRNARRLADAILATPGLDLESPVETNLVWVAVEPSLGTAAQVAARLKERGVLASALGPQTIRFCTHLDVSQEQAETAARAIESLGR
jgi:threonine aldolase